MRAMPGSASAATHSTSKAFDASKADGVTQRAVPARSIGNAPTALAVVLA
jgi:hypothetical protein